MWSSPSVFWMYGAQGVEVEVDKETGQVEVLKIVAAHDVGKAINPLTVYGQIEGGAVCGMGTALMEEVIFDAKGKILNPTCTTIRCPPRWTCRSSRPSSWRPTTARVPSGRRVWASP